MEVIKPYGYREISKYGGNSFNSPFDINQNFKYGRETESFKFLYGMLNHFFPKP